jgi:hypothetical protein
VSNSKYATEHQYSGGGCVDSKPVRATSEPSCAALWPPEKHNIMNICYFNFQRTKNKYYVSHAIRQQELEGKKYSYIQLIVNRNIILMLTEFVS